MKKILLAAIFFSALLAFGAQDGKPYLKKQKNRTSSMNVGAKRGGYLFVHFQCFEQGRIDQEKIQFSLSRDLKNWEILNDGDPILISDCGTQGLRDPFAFRKKDGSVVVIATDLNTRVPGFNWWKASNAGSPHLIVFESRDLVHWSKARAVTPMPGASAAWAPEIVDDDGTPLVIWSGKRKGEKFRILGAHTKNFVDFDEPFVFAANENADVIDADVVKCDGVFFRFVKNDIVKSVSMERADSLHGPWTPVEGYALNDLRAIEAPACILTGNGREAFLFLDHYTHGRNPGYRAYRTDDIFTGKFEPLGDDFKAVPGIKHGGILRLSEKEYQRMKNFDWKK